jgi:metallo-beta-lactamase family protein
LVDKEPSVRIFGEEVPVNCNVENLTSFSGHADRDELFSWMKNFTTPPKMTFTVHGEGTNLVSYAQAIRDELKWNVILPEHLESVVLFNGI